MNLLHAILLGQSVNRTDGEYDDWPTYGYGYGDGRGFADESGHGCGEGPGTFTLGYGDGDGYGRGPGSEDALNRVVDVPFWVTA